jgi:hypothetical protein
MFLKNIKILKDMIGLLVKYNTTNSCSSVSPIILLRNKRKFEKK